MYMLKSGFGTLWKNIVKKEGLKIKYNVQINRIYRKKSYRYGRRPVVWIHQKEGFGGRWKLERYDFLIWSPEMKTSLRYWANQRPKEKLYFYKTKPTWFTTSLVDTLDVVRGPSPIDYFIDNVNTKSGHVWAQRDTFSAVRDFPRDKYQAFETPTGNDRSPIRTTVVYQMTEQGSCPRRLNLYLNLRKTMRNLGASYLNIKVMKTWRYFPRYSIEDLEDGVLWKILEMQGRYGMWYIGSSVSFESVKSVAEYNELILENYQVPSK